MAKPKATFPGTVFLYAVDYDDGEPVYAVANSIEEVDEDFNGDTVGVYTLTGLGRLEVKKTVDLKPVRQYKKSKVD